MPEDILLPVEVIEPLIRKAREGSLMERDFNCLTNTLGWKSYIARDIFTRTVSWAVFTVEYMDALAEFFKGKRVLEVCAGRGILGKHMRARGVDWVCTDLEPEEDSEVVPMDAMDAVTHYKPEWVFASWIPYESDLDWQLAQTGIPCLFITEGYGNCIGSDIFWEKEDSCYRIEDGVLPEDVPNWPGIRDHTIKVVPVSNPLLPASHDPERIRLMLDKAEIINALEDLQMWRDAYHNGQPLVIDAVYDSVEDDVRASIGSLPATDPVRLQAEAFLAQVGAAIPASTGGSGAWQKVKHQVVMGSLNKAQATSEMVDWFRSCTGLIKSTDPQGMVLSEKCDGLSVGINYLDGNLVLAATRGDGTEGEDITRNVLKMQGIVPFIKGFTGFIRGEIILTKSAWKKHFPTYSNPRNAAAGIAKDQAGPGCPHLTVLHYQMIRFGGQSLPNKVAEFKILKHLGAAVPNWQSVTGLSEIEAVYQRYIATDRDALDYDIDGLVVEFNDPTVKETLGDLNNRPRASVAYKFPADAKRTKLQAIRWQVGNAGRVTPVGEFDTVSLAGANVSQASLHNLTNMKELLADHPGVTCFHKGDTILTSRRGDVIPYIEELLTPNLTGDALVPPTVCPECKAPLSMEGEYLVCKNSEECPAQTSGAVKVWVKKIGLKGWGDAIIETLINQQIIADAADLYTLDSKTLADVQMDGRRVGGTADIILTELHAKKELPLHVFIGSLNIPLCSRSTMKTIVDAGYDSLPKMMAATMTQIASIPGMGTGRAEAFCKGLRFKSDLINRLLGNGVKIKAQAMGNMKGKSVCFTGVRDASLERAFEDAGGTVKSSVGKGLTYLVARDPKSTSGKAQKAAQYGVTVLGVEDMWDLLGGRP